MQIREIMIRSVERVSPSATLTEAIETMRKSESRFLPVCDGDKVVGVLTDGDIIERVVTRRRNPRRTRVSAVMRKAFVCCYEDYEISFAARLMAQNNVRHLVVLNRDEALVGILCTGELGMKNALPDSRAMVNQP
jgi:CBS domain-containing protein